MQIQNSNSVSHLWFSSPFLRAARSADCPGTSPFLAVHSGSGASRSDRKNTKVILKDMDNISLLPTEAINPATKNLSRLPAREALLLINDEDHKVAPAVRLFVDEIAQVVEAVAKRLGERNGRLFYIGAGTSGRLGVVDASECPPTFGTPPELVQGIIAGGPQAVFRSIEGAEDIVEEGVRELRERSLTADDAVIGIAASGRTPFVIGGLQFAREIGAFTAGVTVNPEASMKEWCDVFIAPFVGPEALTGSTRMKAGTAQKLVLNMISTGVMLQLGRVEGNIMSDVRPWCEKLVDRAQRNVMSLAKVDAATAQQSLEAANGDVRAAVEWCRQR
ncbi:MAG: N-acetylmuramic acid 6-phosphate etherase [Abditibacteriota bacterium]|nr:N-acetylmuramic acid 6-phosphate etherase [Abditibacteriota bacterium]